VPSNHRLLALVTLVASSIALYFGMGLHPFWWLMWLAPIPVLAAASRLSRGSAFIIAFLAWTIGGLNLWNYYHTVLHIPLAVAMVIILGPALLFAIDVILYRAFLPISLWSAALIFPSFWVLCEFINTRTSPHSTAGSIAYSQMNFPPILQIASVTGILGITFCLFLFASTVGALLSGYGTASQRRNLAAVAIVLAAAILGVGLWRLYAIPPTQNTIAVGLVASDLPQNILAEQPADVLRLMHEYAAQAELLAAKGAKVVVIPEKVAVVGDSDMPEVDALFKSAAAGSGVTIVVGIVHPSAPNRWNEARVYSPDGVVRTYEKHHMVPIFESKDLTPGTTRTTWQESSGTWGTAICKDMDFPDLSRQYGEEAVGLMLVPAWDFEVDGWLHGRTGILRGVESGFSIARSAKEGILTVTDATGRVLAERQSNSAPFAKLVANVPVRHLSTIYARFGDWFAWLDILLFAVLVTASLFRKPGSGRSQS